MANTPEIVDLSPLVLAVAEARVRPGGVPGVIRGLFDAVHAALLAAGFGAVGRNRALYRREGAWIVVQAGRRFEGAFVGSAPVRVIALGPARAAHLRHVGPYEELGIAAEQLQGWVRDGCFSRTGLEREVYGHWREGAPPVVDLCIDIG